MDDKLMHDRDKFTVYHLSITGIDKALCHDFNINSVPSEVDLLTYTGVLCVGNAMFIHSNWIRCLLHMLHVAKNDGRTIRLPKENVFEFNLMDDKTYRNKCTIYIDVDDSDINDSTLSCLCEDGKCYTLYGHKRNLCKQTDNHINDQLIPFFEIKDGHISGMAKNIDSTKVIIAGMMDMMHTGNNINIKSDAEVK
jgi:hypothetical protein